MAHACLTLFGIPWPKYISCSEFYGTNTFLAITHIVPNKGKKKYGEYLPFPCRRGDFRVKRPVWFSLKIRVWLNPRFLICAKLWDYCTLNTQKSSHQCNLITVTSQCFSITEWPSSHSYTVTPGVSCIPSEDHHSLFALNISPLFRHGNRRIELTFNESVFWSSYKG